jgi:amidohydrolase
MNQNIVNNVESIKNELNNISKQLFLNPETTDNEVFACGLLTDYLRENGFEIEIGIFGHSTGFIATFDTGICGPNVGITAEYDALEGLGHACGHNLIAASSVGSAVVLKKMLKKGKITVFGTPGEEGGFNGASKATYVDNNLFKDIDYSCSIHPGPDTHLTCDFIACRTLEVEFFGTASHAATNPELGANALDAMINFFNMINAFRQQIKDDVRIHGIITHGGDMPNVIPAYTSSLFYIRAHQKNDVNNIFDKVLTIANAAAMGSFCDVVTNEVENALDNMVINNTLDRLFENEFIELGETIIQAPAANGSTDVGNISHVVPTTHPTIKIGDSSIVYHTPGFAKAASSECGFEGMLNATKAIVAVVLKISEDEELLKKIKDEFNNNDKKPL